MKTTRDITIPAGTLFTEKDGVYTYQIMIGGHSAIRVDLTQLSQFFKPPDPKGCHLRVIK